MCVCVCACICVYACSSTSEESTSESSDEPPALGKDSIFFESLDQRMLVFGR